MCGIFCNSSLLPGIKHITPRACIYARNDRVNSNEIYDLSLFILLCSRRLSRRLVQVLVVDVPPSWRRRPVEYE